MRMRNRLTALLLAMCLCAALPGAVRAEDAYPAGTVVIRFENGVPAAASSEGWTFDGATLTLDNGHSFAAEGECSVAVVCNGVIEGGRFRGPFTLGRYGTANGGVFYGEFTAKWGATINDAEFPLYFVRNGAEWADGVTVPATYHYKDSCPLPDGPATWPETGALAVEGTDYALDAAGNCTIYTARASPGWPTRSTAGTTSPGAPPPWPTTSTFWTAAFTATARPRSSAATPGCPSTASAAPSTAAASKFRTSICPCPTRTRGSSAETTARSAAWRSPAAASPWIGCRSRHSTPAASPPPPPGSSKTVSTARTSM